MNILGITLAITTMISWGVSDLLAKVALNHESKWRVIFLGQLLGALMMLGFVLILTDFQNLFSKYFIYLLAMGAINVIGMFTFYKAIQKKGVALTSPVVNSWAFITVILGALFYKELPTPLQFTAIILIIVGVFLASLEKKGNLKLDWSSGFAILSMLSWGIFYFVLKIPNEIFGALMVTFSVKFLSSVFSAPLIIFKKIKLLPSTKKAYLLILIIAALDTIGFLTYNTAVTYSPVYIVAPIISAVPLVSVVLGIAILKEIISLKQSAGIVLTIIGLIIIAM